MASRRARGDTTMRGDGVQPAVQMGGVEGVGDADGVGRRYVYDV